MSTDIVEDKALQILRSADGRITKPRLRILSAVLEADQALSHAAIQQSLPDLDRVSIYRVLDWLVQQKIAERLMGSKGVWLYRVADQKHQHHPHFQCLECGDTHCLPSVTTNTENLPKEYRPVSTTVIITGICPECDSKSNTTPHNFYELASCRVNRAVRYPRILTTSNQRVTEA